MRPTHCLLVLALLLPACGSEGTGDEISRLVTITNQWSNTASAQHFFSLVAVTGEGTAAGTFEGCEARPTPAGHATFHGCPDGGGFHDTDDYEVEGSWADNVVTLRTARPGGTRTFRAEVSTDNPTTLRFVDTVSGETIVMQRGE